MNSKPPEQHDRCAVDIALLVARIIVGIVFMAHGSQKLFGAFGGQGFSATIQSMGTLGYFLIAGEFFGGLGLIVGFLSRFSAASLTVIMIGAIVQVHARFGFFMNWFGKKQGEGFEYHLLAIALFLVILIAGPGRITILHLLPLPRTGWIGRFVTIIE